MNKYKLFFYARPNNPRNLFTYGVYILKEAIKRGIISSENWEIYCAGQDVPVIHFGENFESINMGQMDWDEYGAFLQQVDLTLSLMYTPHPSYPPFDAACSGSVVLTNVCANKREFNQSLNVIMSELDIETMMDSFEKAVELAKDMEKRKLNYEASSIPREWNIVLDETLQWMKEKTRDV